MVSLAVVSAGTGAARGSGCSAASSPVSIAHGVPFSESSTALLYESSTGSLLTDRVLMIPLGVPMR